MQEEPVANTSVCSLEEIEIYNLTCEQDAADQCIKKFHPGDHVYMWCEATGIRYQHHGIVLYASDTQLKIADFTAPDSGTFALPDSIASGQQYGSYRLPQWHGVRITTYNNLEEWEKEEYREEKDVSLVLQRVQFLLSNPHLIPEYELLVSNCETVARWCKTGSFRTHQIAGLVDGGKRNSATMAASSVLASSILGPLATPVIVGSAISFSALALKERSHENTWRERTKILNIEFDKWRRGQEGCIVC
ncbi:hypothetical protein ACHAXN_003338 [Cyclotella atomus]